MANLQSRKKFILVAIVVLVAIAALIVFSGSRDDSKQQEQEISDGPKCGYHILEKSKAVLEPQKVAELEPIVKEIEQIPGYDQDVNCIYVVLTYYINMSESQKARELYTKLSAIYSPDTGYATVISDTARPPEQLKSTIDYLEAEASKDQSLNDALGGQP